MSDQGQRFSGGDNLTGFPRLVHEAMMQNEIYGGYGAYQLSHAKTPKSGFSFGGNQMDLASNEDARKGFKEILENAKNEAGEYIYGPPSDERSEKIKKIVDRAAKQGNPNEFSADELKKIDAALSSDYGVDKINELYQNDIADRVSHVEDIINSTAETNPGNLSFLNQDAVKLRLVDFHNQFDMSNGGKLARYIRGEEIHMNGHTLKASETMTMEDIYRFTEHTQHVEKYPGDVARRRQNIERILEDHGIDPLKPEVTYPTSIAIDSSVVFDNQGGQMRISQNQGQIGRAADGCFSPAANSLELNVDIQPCQPTATQLEETTTNDTVTENAPNAANEQRPLTENEILLAELEEGLERYNQKVTTKDENEIENSGFTMG